MTQAIYFAAGDKAIEQHLADNQLSLTVGSFSIGGIGEYPLLAAERRNNIGTRVVASPGGVLFLFCRFKGVITCLHLGIGGYRFFNELL